MNSIKAAAGKMMRAERTRELRELLSVSKGIPEIREFYSKINVLLKQRNIIGGSLVIPDMVLDRIKILVSQYSGLYDEVTVVPVQPDGRAWISVGNGKAFWKKTNESFDEITSNIDMLEMDEIKLSGYIPVDNSTLNSTMVDIALYVEELLAKSLAIGLDDGIINGQGDYATIWEPMGIIDNLDALNDVEADLTVENILSKIDLIDIGNKDDIGEVVAVMKRKTYYKKILHQVNNNLPYPNINGLRVRFSAAVPADCVILGDFKEYILAERKEIRIENSDQNRYMEEQIVYRVAGRYDGRPHNSKAFVRITQPAV